MDADRRTPGSGGDCGVPSRALQIGARMVGRGAGLWSRRHLCSKRARGSGHFQRERVRTRPPVIVLPLHRLRARALRSIARPALLRSLPCRAQCVRRRRHHMQGMRGRVVPIVLSISTLLTVWGGTKSAVRRQQGLRGLRGRALCRQRGSCDLHLVRCRTHCARARRRRLRAVSSGPRCTAQVRNPDNTRSRHTITDLFLFRVFPLPPIPCLLCL